MNSSPLQSSGTLPLVTLLLYVVHTCLFGLLMLDASLASTLLDAIPAETVNPSSCSTARRIAAVNRAPARRARSNALVGSTRWPAVP